MLIGGEYLPHAHIIWKEEDGLEWWIDPETFVTLNCGLIRAMPVGTHHWINKRRIAVRMWRENKIPMRFNEYAVLNKLEYAARPFDGENGTCAGEA